jgi:hypothetical protein
MRIVRELIGQKLAGQERLTHVKLCDSTVANADCRSPLRSG